MTLVGQKAPDFTAKAVVGQEIVDYTLSQNWKAGRTTVLWFYPLDFTFVCPTELLAFNERLQEFKDRDVAVVSVSIDSQFSHLAWKNTHVSEGGVGDIQYPMVADVKKEITRAYGIEHPTGVAYRGLFLIDKTGTVRHCTVNDLPLGRSVTEVLRMVDALHYTDEHGEVCPADWSEGKDALKPTSEGLKSYMKRSSTVEISN